MQNQITQFTDEQLIAEIDAVLGDYKDQLTMEEKIKVLQNLDINSAQEGIHDRIIEELVRANYFRIIIKKKRKKS